MQVLSMSTEVYLTRDEDETIALGQRLAAQWRPPVVVLLIGDLGAGKTTMAKGLTAGFGVDSSDVASPTYALIHEYGDPPAVYHIDLYRLDTLEEVETLGLDEILAGGSAVIMEWAERFPSLLPEERIEIRLTTIEDEVRRIEVNDLRGPRPESQS